MNVLYVGYPLLAVSDESCGGAEQVLCAVERGMSARGHRTTVAAAAGSRCAGALLATGKPAEHPDQLAEREREQWEVVRSALADAAPGSDLDVDLVHDHSGSFWRHAPELDVPVLATLHLPRSLYAPESFAGLPETGPPENVFFNCVSQSQAAAFSDLPGLLGVVENGIALDRFSPQLPRHKDDDDFVLWLGRVCEEKGPHLAIAAARQARARIVLAGDVYPFKYHMDFWERSIAREVDGEAVGFVARPAASRKLDLLRRARAVLIPSQVAETSSLVAMEAMASGTPVIAFRSGALAELVADGETGFLVDSVAEMAQAIGRVHQIEPEACRARAAARHSLAAMLDGYERLYRQVAARDRAELLAVNRAS